jgi:hypothetical protein
VLPVAGSMYSGTPKTTVPSAVVRIGVSATEYPEEFESVTVNTELTFNPVVAT